MQILSDNNMRIKTYSKLKQKKYRQKMSLYVLEGLRSCSDALKDKIPIESTFCTEELFEWANALNFPNIEVVSQRAICELSDTVTPQGIVCICKQPNMDFGVAKGNSLILDNIQDPGNLGTLIRSAVAFGFDDIYLIKTVDLFNEKVVRSSMSAISKANFHNCTYEQVEKNKIDVCDIMLVGDMDGEDIRNFKKSNVRYAIVIGNEGNGVNDILLRTSDKVVKIQIKNIESLNASIAGSILMYELNKGE